MARLARQMTGVSVRTCARELGISDTAILKAIKAGRCNRHPDGSVDVEAVRAGMNLTAARWGAASAMPACSAACRSPRWLQPRHRP